MFFYIGNSPPVMSGLSQVEPNLWLDSGWDKLNSIYFKGYSTECTLSKSLPDIIDGYQPDGKWCVINEGTIYHPKFRGFPIYEYQNDKTNIKLENYNIVLYDYTFQVTDDDPITMDDASDLIGKLLFSNIENFYKFNACDSMNVLYSGGLDTLTSWAVFDAYKKDYNLHIYVPKPEDNTLHKHNGRIREYTNDLMTKVSSDYWGYNVSSFFTNQNYYITGFYAEVMQFRDAEAINALANYHNKWIDEIAEESDYLYWFLKRPSLKRYKSSMLSFHDEIELKKYLLGTVLYDNQMWHLDKNFMLNPFADLRIPQIMYRLSIDDILKNALTGQIQKNIVSKFNPDLLCLLSDYKNEKNIWSNFRKNWNTNLIHNSVRLLIR